MRSALALCSVLCLSLVCASGLLLGGYAAWASRHGPLVRTARARPALEVPPVPAQGPRPLDPSWGATRAGVLREAAARRGGLSTDCELRGRVEGAEASWTLLLLPAGGIAAKHAVAVQARRTRPHADGGFVFGELARGTYDLVLRDAAGRTLARRTGLAVPLAEPLAPIRAPAERELEVEVRLRDRDAERPLPRAKVRVLHENAVLASSGTDRAGRAHLRLRLVPGLEWQVCATDPELGRLCEWRGHLEAGASNGKVRLVVDRPGGR